jgi:hypothetical protein
MRKYLMHLLNLIGHRTKYYDVNAKAEELSLKYGCPLIADTDLHARNRNLLHEMGTGRIIANVRGETPNEIFSSMKSSIFAGDYRNVCDYVSMKHLLRAYGVPLLLPFMFKNPHS